MAKSEQSSSSSSMVDSAPRPWESYNTVYTNAKAGMEGVDKEKVQRVVYEMSKGSKYFENEERKEAYMKQKIENMRNHRANLKATDISHYQRLADKRIAELDATRDLSRIWLHVDMDAFYAAVETLSNPSLKGKPMAVGSMSMISTANYEARKFGVRAAMPGFIACKLCPELIFVPTDFKKYTYYSDLTRKVYHEYDPNFTAASLDEAYLDITKVCKERDLSGGEVAEELRENVYKATGLTCSAGVAPNRLLAKVCSDINKPNGQFVLPNDRVAIMTFISSLPIRKIGGIGKVTEHILKDVFEIKTCEDLLQKSSLLFALFSPSSAEFFVSVGLGLGGTEAPNVRSRKSMSNERTFSATKDEAFFNQKLVELSEMLSADMEKEGLHGKTLTLKLKTASFEVRTRAMTLQSYIWSSKDILKHASKLLKAELPVSLRLIGLRMSHFNEDKGGSGVSDPTQRTLLNFIKSGECNKETVVDEEHSDPSFEIDDENICSLNDDHEESVVENLQVTETCCSDNNETGPSSSSSSLMWLDDYKCLVCGIELPPSFVEERQEHSDFHLAQKLQQQEESGQTDKNLSFKHRMMSHKDGGVEKGKGKKKQKHSVTNVHAQVNDDSFDPYATLFSPYTKQEWRSYQEKKINEGRKTELTFEVSYVNGTKVKGAKLYIKQLTSDFHWGCGMTHRILNNTAYKKWFASRFTAADFHNELKWYWTEAIQGQENYADPDAMMKFADEHGIIVRGHTILWDDVKYNKKWVKKLSPEQLLEAANRRVDSVVNRYKGRLIGWDVMNENLHHNFFEKRLGKNASSLFFNRVHKIDPNAILFMNEFNTTEHVNDEYAPPVKYLRRMKKIQSFPGNSEIKMGIGLESHYGAEPIDFHYVRSSLDSLSQMGLPIWLTELDVKMDPNLKNSSGLQVIYLEEILRESFSHEAVKAMIIWTGASIDGCDVMCMTDENLVNTPIGDLIDGLMEEWRTGEIEAMADFNGSCQVWVFNGGYEVKVVDPVSNGSSCVSLKVDKVSIPDKMVHVQIMG